MPPHMPPLMPPPGQGLIFVILELIFSLIIISLSTLIYTQTQELYKLTGHKGIRFFKNTYLFFGLAFGARFIHQLLRFSGIMGRNWFIGPVFLFLIGYLGTLAVIYLFLTRTQHITKFTVLKDPNPLYVHGTALLISLIAFFTRSHLTIALIQTILILFGFLISWQNKKHRLMYILLSVFWLLNILNLGPPHQEPFSLRLGIYVVSSIIFAVLYHKVHVVTQ